MSLSESINPQLNIARSELIYEEDQSLSAEDFLALHQSALNHPGGLTIVHGKSSLERRIPHSKEAGVHLQVVWATASQGSPQVLPVENGFIAPGKVSTYRQLGVIEPDGLMYFGVEQREIEKARFDDPFLKMIISYFTSHLEAA